MPLRKFAALAAIALVAACSSRTVRDAATLEASRAQTARTITETAKRVAVSKPGAKVCRQMTVGISERDWIRGSVIEVGSDRIRIRIDDAGSFPHALDGVALARGVSLWDATLNWTPCT